MKDRIVGNLEDSTPVDAFGNKADIVPDNGPVVLHLGTYRPKMVMTPNADSAEFNQLEMDGAEDLNLPVDFFKGFDMDFEALETSDESGDRLFDAFRNWAEETRNKDFDGEVLDQISIEDFCKTAADKYGKKNGFYRGRPTRTLGECEIPSWRVFERATIVNSKGKKGIKKRRTVRVVTCEPNYIFNTKLFSESHDDSFLSYFSPASNRLTEDDIRDLSE